MTEVIKLVQGDSRPSLVITVKDQFTTAPINLTSATVVLKFKEVGALTLKGTVPGSVIDPVNGKCIFHWFSVPNILNGDAGNYEGEVEATFSDGSVQTVYELLRFKLREQL